MNEALDAYIKGSGEVLNSPESTRGARSFVRRNRERIGDLIDEVLENYTKMQKTGFMYMSLPKDIISEKKEIFQGDIIFKGFFQTKEGTFSSGYFLPSENEVFSDSIYIQPHVYAPTPEEIQWVSKTVARLTGTPLFKDGDDPVSYVMITGGEDGLVVRIPELFSPSPPKSTVGFHTKWGAIIKRGISFAESMKLFEECETDQFRETISKFFGFQWGPSENLSSKMLGQRIMRKSLLRNEAELERC